MFTKAVVQRCSKKVFLEILQSSQENTCARVSFLIKHLVQVFSCEFWEISKNTFSYRTPPVAASVFIKEAFLKTSKSLPPMISCEISQFI